VATVSTLLRGVRQRGHQDCMGGTRGNDGIWVFSNIGMVFESLHAKIVVFESFTQKSIVSKAIKNLVGRLTNADSRSN
jgi:hypothetical protein